MAVLRRVLLALAALVAAWLVACVVLFVFPPAESGPPKHADAVVVLSGDHARLAPAERLVRAGVAPTLAISSVGRTPGWTAARRLCAAGRYASARVVCFEANPYSTRGEAETVARLARARRWRSLVVVSSTFHLTRVDLLFHRCWTGDLSLVGAPYPWWRQPEQWATETGKLLVQVFAERAC
ncbi:MAG TPA: ElyC/SanA/YdcF family protein [Gaiellaceae bacterium]|nr:ElyC/SanA/YdcF family protein [Gaiellaceae bacterium]